MSDTLSMEDTLGLEIGQPLAYASKVRTYERVIKDKWEKKGWLNSEKTKKAELPELKNKRQELAMALILENQARFQRVGQKLHPVITGADGRQYAAIQQDVTTADEVLPTRLVLPIIRRAYALIMQADFSQVQPIAQPSAFVFWLDFLREQDTSNLLSVEYNAFLTPELGVPQKGKLRLNSRQITAVKQLMGVTWSLESEEDARAVLGLDIEAELMNAFTLEFVRNVFARHLLNIITASQSAVPVGQSLPSPWNAANPVVNIPSRGSNTITDYKSIVYNSLIDADVNFIRANKRPSTGIVAGFGMAGFLRKLITATGEAGPDQQMMSSVGVSNYGTYAERWNIWGTEYLPDNLALLYLRDPEPLYAGHIYAPYVPMMTTPRIYGDYDPVTGNYQNKDAYSRNIRERSADTVTKPYSFLPVLGPSPLTF